MSGWSLPFSCQEEQMVLVPNGAQHRRRGDG